jgi:hypothetical protein
MSTDSTNTIAEGEALEDFLVSLADGLSSAQQELNTLSQTSSNGMLYHIPKLEFELKLQMSSYSTSASQESSIKKRSTLQVSPPVNSQQSSAASTIKGVFVATPSNQGKPGYSLNLSFGLIDNNELPIYLSLTDNIGEPQTGVAIEVNIDRQQSELINGSDSISNSTNLNDGILTTDQNGSATTTLNLSGQETSQTAIAITADALGSNQTLIYRVV